MRRDASNLRAGLELGARHLTKDAAVEISSGTVSQTLAHPREILHPVVNRNAYAFFLMHNHPSGDPSPSNQDLQLTTRIRDASELMQIRFIDHVIIGPAGIFTIETKTWSKPVRGEARIVFDGEKLTAGGSSRLSGSGCRWS